MTHASVDRDDLHEEIRRFVQSKFRDGTISDVFIKEDVGADGAPLLLVTATYAGATDRFRREKPAGMMRMLRDHLTERGEDSFPMLSYVSSAEART